MQPEYPTHEYFYAHSNTARTEEEFEELPEGALVRIQRRVTSAGSAAAAVTAILTFAMLAYQGGQAVAYSQVPETVKAPSQVQVATAVPAEASVSNLDPKPVEEAELIALAPSVPIKPAEVVAVAPTIIRVELPAPSVIAVAKVDEAPSTAAAGTSDYVRNALPLPRHFAMAVAEDLEDRPLAQGSDDEAAVSEVVAPGLSLVAATVHNEPRPKQRPSSKRLKVNCGLPETAVFSVRVLMT